MKIIKLIGLVTLIGIGYLVYVWIASVKEIEHVCNQIQAGQAKCLAGYCPAIGSEASK